MKVEQQYIIHNDNVYLNTTAFLAEFRYFVERTREGSEALGEEFPELDGMEFILDAISEVVSEIREGIVNE